MKYDRLTKRDIHGNAVVFNYTKTTGEFKTVVDRLAKLEDKIENGTLVELPCQVGTLVYHIDKEPFGDYVIDQESVYGYADYGDGLGLRILINSCSPCIRCLGDNLFFTYAEAEIKLRELNGVINNGKF